MTPLELAALITIFFVTSVIGVVTGANSLITVPVMLQFGVEPRTAIATNMLALTFMSVGATLPFVGKRVIDRGRSPLLVVLTLLGSVLGALLVFAIPPEALPLIISVAMITVAVFVMVRRNAGVTPARGSPSVVAELAGYAATFALGIYGGFFSGGYVTLLTASYVTFFRSTFLEAVATTKLVNIFSSAVATAIFVQQGVVDFKLGVILSLTMFVGATLGARLTLRVDNLLLRRVFLAAVMALALKTLLYDVLWQRLA
jgi:uncharacterized membrane protein YfcA